MLNYTCVFAGGLLRWLSGKESASQQETQFRFLGQEDSLEKEMATDSSILVWKIPRTEEPGRLQTIELRKGRT